MSLLHPSSVGASVGLWFSNGVPVRLVYEGTRYRVIGKPEPVADGWVVSTRDSLGRESRFTIGPSDSGWALRGVR